MSVRHRKVRAPIPAPVRKPNRDARVFLTVMGIIIAGIAVLTYWQQW